MMVAQHFSAGFGRRRDESRQGRKKGADDSAVPSGRVRSLGSQPAFDAQAPLFTYKQRLKHAFYVIFTNRLPAVQLCEKPTFMAAGGNRPCCPGATPTPADFSNVSTAWCSGRNRRRPRRVAGGEEAHRIPGRSVGMAASVFATRQAFKTPRRHRHKIWFHPDPTRHRSAG